MAQDATAAWDQVCAGFHFPTVEGATITNSFQQAYTGNTFAADFKGVLKATAELMSTDVPYYDADDLLRASVTNWPDS